MSERGSLQDLVEAPAEPTSGWAAPPGVSDPVALFAHLEANGTFHRDTGLGRIFHRRQVSLRENRRSDSLHILIDGNRIAGHVDRLSPLGLRPDRPSGYSIRQAAAHNVAGMGQDLVRLLRGREGDHRCRLDCEWTWDPADSVPHPADLLDPSGWNVELEARVDGSLDEDRLRRAVAVVVAGRRPETDPVDVLGCADDLSLDEARSRARGTPVPVDRWPPLRVTLARQPDGDVVILHVNHAAADGPGALLVLRAIADAYAAGDVAGARPLDLPVAGDVPVRPASPPVSTSGARYRTAVERLRDALARPARLAPEGAVDEPGYGLHRVRLTTEDSRLAVEGDATGISRNVMVAALHLAVGDWNLAHGTPGRSVGVLVPVDLRPPGWPQHTVGNFSVTARVSTARRHRSGPESALREITGQADRNKRTRTGTALLAALARSGLVPLWAKQSIVVIQPLTRNRHVDTVMLADLGRVEEPPSFGHGLSTVEMWFSAPARTPASLCIGALTLAGRLHLAFRYPHRLFDAEAARLFGEYYLSRLRSVDAHASRFLPAT